MSIALFRDHALPTHLSVQRVPHSVFIPMAPFSPALSAQQEQKKPEQDEKTLAA